MIQNKSLKANYSQTIAAKQYKIGISQKIVNKTVKSVSQFSFIDSSQWILLLLLNTVCFIFIIRACAWIKF